MSNISNRKQRELIDIIKITVGNHPQDVIVAANGDVARHFDKARELLELQPSLRRFGSQRLEPVHMTRPSKSRAGRCKYVDFESCTREVRKEPGNVIRSFSDEDRARRTQSIPLHDPKDRRQQ